MSTKMPIFPAQHFFFVQAISPPAYMVERGLRDPAILTAVNLVVRTYTRPGPFFAALAQAMKGEAAMPPEPDSTLPPLLFSARQRPSPFGLLLAQRRKAMAGPSQQTLADRSGYTKRNLSKVEHGRQDPSAMTGVTMVVHAGLNVEAFFDELYMRLISECASSAG